MGSSRPLHTAALLLEYPSPPLTHTRNPTATKKLAVSPRVPCQVIYVDVRDLRPLESSYLLDRRRKGDRVVEITLAYNEREWLPAAWAKVAALELDILL